VELPEVADLRARVLPDGSRRRTFAGDALEESWLDEVDPARGVLVSAQGVLMYLQPAEVHGLVDRVGARLPGGGLLFDAVPRWFSARTVAGRMRTARGYAPPPMPWGMDASELPAFRAAHPAVAALRRVPLPRGRGPLYGLLVPLSARLPLLRDARPSVLLARFR
jgi:O-methyltransferase involved in polyketide biosynthesis